MTQDNGFAFDDPEAFTRMWSEFASRMASSGMAFTPDAPPPEAARQVRNAMFEAMGNYCDQYMRSPQFLQAMKQSMDGAIAFRKQLNAFLTRWQHELQGVAQEDVDSLMDRMGDLQKTVVRRIDALSERLDQIATRLDRLENRGQGKTREASGQAVRKRPQTPSTKASTTRKAAKPEKSAKTAKPARPGKAKRPAKKKTGK